MIIFILVYLGVVVIGGIIALCALVVRKLDKEGLKVKKHTRLRRKTYNDGLGKYTVNIREEEWVRVPKDQNK